MKNRVDKNNIKIMAPLNQKKIFLGFFAVLLCLLAAFAIFSIANPRGEEQQTTNSSDEITSDMTRNLNLISILGMGINPEVRDRKDYSSFKFGLEVSDETREKLEELDTVVFLEEYGKELGRVEKKYFTLNLDGYPHQLIVPVPVVVADYFKDKEKSALRFQLLSKEKIYAEQIMSVSDGYMMKLVLNTPAREFGTPTRISIDTLLVPRSCALIDSETNDLVASLQPDNVSNPSLPLAVLPKDISVYGKCELESGEIAVTEPILIN